MKASAFNGFLVFVTMAACIDPIVFDIPPARELLVVDGSITDEPGPYKVRLSRGANLAVVPDYDATVSGASIVLYEDGDISENFVEIAPGEYFTGGVIRGRVGHSYHIAITTADGQTFQSEPETIAAGGSVSAIRYEYEERDATRSFGLVNGDVFNVYIDGDVPTESNGNAYVRWRYTGTYRVATRPELHTTFLQASAYMTPLPCSGYVVEPAPGGGKLVKVGPCFCCVCWVEQYETKPQLSDTELVTEGRFRNLKVGEIPITPATFFDKFMIEVEQMSLSRTAFEYFRLIRTQKEGAADLFQPAPGRLRGNILATDTSYPVVGLFWATSVRKETIFVSRSDVPYNLPPYDVIPTSCLEAYDYSTTTKPANWNE